MKTKVESTMAPIVVLILGKVLDYLSDNADEIISAIKDQFVTAHKDSDVHAAIQELGYEPTEENLVKLSNLLQSKGEDPAKLASILVTKAVV